MSPSLMFVHVYFSDLQVSLVGGRSDLLRIRCRMTISKRVFDIDSYEGVDLTAT